jgi:FkbM family methyltransferase
VNVVERCVDGVDPVMSAWLRALKKRWQRDPVRRLMAGLVPPGAVAVDAGANHGVYTYILSALTGPSGRVHSIEPYPGNAARLRTLARRLGNVTFHNVALSDSAGEAALHIPVHRGRRIDALATLGPAPGSRADECRVPLRTLDSLLHGERGRVALLKCDVEGHEDHVLRGARSILVSHRPAVIAEIEQRHREDSIDTTFSYLLGLGYAGYFLTPSGLQPLGRFDVRGHQLSLLPRGFLPYRVPAGYVSDFLFVWPGTDVTGLLVRPPR